MYINLTIDLSRYDRETIDLRISDRQPVQQLIRTLWKMNGIKTPPRTGCWIRVENKKQMIRGFDILREKHVANGDKLVIL